MKYGIRSPPPQKKKREKIPCPFREKCGMWLASGYVPIFVAHNRDQTKLTRPRLSARVLYFVNSNIQKLAFTRNCSVSTRYKV